MQTIQAHQPPAEPAAVTPDGFNSLAVFGLELAAALVVMAIGAAMLRNVVGEIKTVLEELPTLPAPSETDAETTRERYRSNALDEFKNLVGWRSAPGYLTLGFGALLLVIVLISRSKLQ